MIARLKLLALLVGCAVGLSACSFKPLYGQSALTSNMGAIEVIAPEGRTGYLIQGHMEDALARNRGVPPAYRMNLQLAEARYPRGVRVDNVATRYEYVLTAAYTLTSVASGATAKTGRVRVELTYDSADQPYASIAAQQDAQDRAAQEAARRIQLELAVWFANGEKS